MSRLQKKCLIGSASLHALLFLVLFLGAVFRPEEEVVYASEVMTLVYDQAIASARPAQTAQPVAQPVEQPRQPEPTPEPEPVREPVREPEPPPVQPEPTPQPVRRPDPEPVQPRRVEPTPPPVVRETPTPTPPPRTEPERPAWTPTAPKINLNQLQVKRDTSTAVSQAQAARAAAEAARREKERQQRLESAINNSVSSISSRASDLQFSAPQTAGTLGVSYAGFEAALQRVYLRAWTPAAGLADDDETTAVKVRVARDGRILSAEISKGSGNSRLDASVRAAIDRVKSVGQPFPPNAREDSREYILKFNLKAKNLAG